MPDTLGYKENLMDSTLAECRHSIRGTLNALKLCISALELPLARSEKIAFLCDIEESAERLIAQLQQLSALAGEPAVRGPLKSLKSV
jgi:hypothetical protein